MYTLYDSSGSASLAVRWRLRALGIGDRHETVHLAAGQQRLPDELQLNPKGRVPTVDSAPIFVCAPRPLPLAERHPEAGWAPAAGIREPQMPRHGMLRLAKRMKTGPAFVHLDAIAGLSAWA
jgi:glutathione S-transferase